MIIGDVEFNIFIILFYYYRIIALRFHYKWRYFKKKIIKGNNKIDNVNYIPWIISGWKFFKLMIFKNTFWPFSKYRQAFRSIRTRLGCKLFMLHYDWFVKIWRVLSYDKEHKYFHYCIGITIETTRLHILIDFSCRSYAGIKDRQTDKQYSLLKYHI